MGQCLSSNLGSTREKDASEKDMSGNPLVDESKKATVVSQKGDNVHEVGRNVARSHRVRKRLAVAAQAIHAESSVIIPAHTKTSVSLGAIFQAMDGNLLFSGLTWASKHAIANSMEPMNVEEGDVIIQQGDEDASKYFVVDRGSFEVTKEMSEGEEAQVLGVCNIGSGFGELALLYSCPRSATVTAMETGKVWVMERSMYQAIVQASARRVEKRKRELLDSVPIFSFLSDDRKDLLKEIMKVEEYHEDEYLMRQGEEGDRLFILDEGFVSVVAHGSKVAELKEGSYFGERALVQGNERRTADIIATTYTICFTIDSKSLEQNSGTLQQMWIYEALRRVDLFSPLGETQLLELAKVMIPEHYKSGDVIFKQGDVGHCFYVVEKGSCSVLDSKGIEIACCTEGQCFGERALINSEVRSATVCAKEDTTLLSCTRNSFIHYIGHLDEIRDIWKIEALRKVPLLQGLTKLQVNGLCKQLKTEVYEAGQTIVSYGDIGDAFYIIQNGECEVLVRRSDSQSSNPVQILSSGHHFGERSLLRDEPRAATVRAKTKSSLLVLSKKTFQNDLKSIHQLLSGKLAAIDRVVSAHKIKERIKKRDIKFIRQLGYGAFGRVYLVQYTGNNRKYALKQIKKSKVLKNKLAEHVVRERAILDSLDSPFIVNLASSFQDDGNLYMLMQCISGGEFFQYLNDRKKPLGEEEAKFYAACVILGLEYLQERSIAWRDLKPENLLFDSSGYLVLTDFGFAKRIIKGSKSYTMCGTPEYIAPEIIAQSGHTGAVDWWALGVLIYEMVAGTPPFQDEDRVALFEAITSLDYQMPRYFSTDLKDFIRKLLHKLPNKRLGNGSEGFKNVKKHPWFSSFDWQALERREMVAPYIPSIKIEASAPGSEDSGGDHCSTDSDTSDHAVGVNHAKIFSDF